MTSHPKSVADLRAQQVLLRRDVHELENIIADQIDILPEKLMPDFLTEPGSLVGNLAKKGLNMITGNAFSDNNSEQAQNKLGYEGESPIYDQDVYEYDQIGYESASLSDSSYQTNGLSNFISSAKQFIKSPLGKMVISVAGSVIAKKITKSK